MNAGIPYGQPESYAPAVPTNRLAEAGIDLRAGWSFIHNPEPFVARPRLTIPTNVIKITANVPLVGLREYAIPIQVADGWLFDQRWNGYLFAAAGLIRHLDLEGDRYSAPAPGPDHSLRLFGALRLIGGGPQLAIAPWWQMAYTPKQGGGEPPLVPQFRWWPGLSGGVALSFRDNLERDQTPTAADWNAAQEARRRLLLVADPRMSSGGRHRIEADPDAAELAFAPAAREAKREHPTWTQLRIAHQISLVDVVEDEGRSRHPERAAVARLERYLKLLCKVERAERGA